MLIAIFLFNVLIRMIAVFQPLAGYFGSYQAVNGMMAEMMLRDGGEHLLAVRTFLIYGGEPGLHLLYFPFGSAVAALLKWISGLPLDIGGRLQAVFFMSGSVIIVHAAAQKMFADWKLSFWSAVSFSLFPIALLSGILFQNEASGFFFLILSFYLVLCSGSFSAAAAGFCFGLALVARVHFVFLYPALFIQLLAGKHRISRSLLFHTVSALPFFAWYGFLYVVTHAHQEQVMTSFFIQAGEGRLFDLRLLTSSAFMTRMADLLALRVLGPVGALLAVYGAFSKKKIPLSIHFWTIGALFTAVILPQKVADHPFYLVALCFPAALYAGRAIAGLAEQRKGWLVLTLFTLFFISAMRYYIPPAVSGYRSTPDPRALGRAVDDILPADSRIIAEFGSTPNLLFYANRYGWAFNLDMKPEHLRGSEVHKRMIQNGYGQPEKWLEFLRSNGAEYFVVSAPDKLKGHTKFYGYLNDHYSSQELLDGRVLVFNLNGSK